MAAPATSDLAPGRLVFDRYRLEERVGRGGMADVWRAHDERLDRSVAIKVLHPQLLPDESWRRRFVAEARAASSLTHPGIVPVYDVIDDPKLPAIVFQFINGESLAARLHRDGSVPLEDATRIGAQVAEALDHAHRAGLVHRDVKPANILLEADDGRARLADFGIARVVDDAQAELTGDQQVLGTLRYMAPEQLAGKGADARTDLYALGLVLAEMVPDLEHAPEWLRHLVGRLRAPDPDDRPASAGDVARALESGSLPAWSAEADAGTSHDDGVAPDDPTVSIAATSAPVIPVERPTSYGPKISPLAPAVSAAAAAQGADAMPAASAAPPPAQQRSVVQTGLRPVAIAVLVAGVILAGIALVDHGFGPGAGGAVQSPHATATSAPVIAPAPAPAGPKKDHGKGHGGGRG